MGLLGQCYSITQLTMKMATVSLMLHSEAPVAILALMINITVASTFNEEM